jgi:hypothetical protein
VPCDPRYGKWRPYKAPISVRYLFITLCFFGALPLFSQKDSAKTKKSFYLSWGYNREAYTTSTLHFRHTGTGENEQGSYDFVVKDVKAHDRPDFDQLYDIVNITIPQFNARVGFWLNNKNDEGFELSYDHAKYVVTNYQTARFVGTINGVYVDKDSILDPNYFHFEHTDGANFLMINYMKRNRIYNSRSGNFKFGYVFKPGGGVVIPRTDVTLFGKHLNNKFKVAGISAAIETALRMELYKHFIVELSGKAGYANYLNSLCLGKGLGRVNHQFGFVEGILCVGYQFYASKRGS